MTDFLTVPSISLDELGKFVHPLRGPAYAIQNSLSGLWQVSGWSETSHQQRVDYDRVSVHNRSVWLDLCILFRAIGTVLSSAGAF